MDLWNAEFHGSSQVIGGVFLQDIVGPWSLPYLALWFVWWIVFFFLLHTWRTLFVVFSRGPQQWVIWSWTEILRIIHKSKPFLQITPLCQIFHCSNKKTGKYSMLGNGRCPSSYVSWPKVILNIKTNKNGWNGLSFSQRGAVGNPPKMMMSRYFGDNNIIFPAVFWQTFNKCLSGGRTVLTDSNHQCPLWLTSSCQCDQLQNWEETCDQLWWASVNRLQHIADATQF